MQPHGPKAAASTFGKRSRQPGRCHQPAGNAFLGAQGFRERSGGGVLYQGKRYRQALEKCQASRVTVRRHAKSLAVPISLIKRAEAAGHALATFDRAQELSQDPISQSVSGWIKSSHMYVVGLNHVICMWLDYIR